MLKDIVCPYLGCDIFYDLSSVSLYKLVNFFLYFIQYDKSEFVDHLNCRILEGFLVDMVIKLTIRFCDKLELKKHKVEDFITRHCNSLEENLDQNEIWRLEKLKEGGLQETALKG